MVKAGALGDAHVKSWDRTWSNPGFEKSPQGRVGTEVTSPSNCGRRKPNFKFFISLDKILIRMEMSHLAVFPSFSSISLLPVLSYRR